jgi:hypothetical protein
VTFERGRGLLAELGAVKLGDKRLEQRLLKIADAVVGAPGKSFPQMFEDDADLEALYRFLRNDKVELEKVLEPHLRATGERVQKTAQALVIHDTSGFSFAGEAPREGLGRMKKGGQGFYAHVALAVDGKSGVPLGVLGLRTIFRTKPPIPYPDKKRKRHDREREFERWETLFEEVHERAGAASVVHVMDREADAFSLLAAMQNAGAHFVVRCRTDRTLEASSSSTKLFDTLSALDVITTREVPLRRKRQDRMMRLRKAPGRMQRLAAVAIRATRVEIKQPPYSGGKSKRDTGLPDTLSINVVHVTELAPPEGEEPVDWKLLTTQPIDSPQDVGAVVDIYRRRWLIEEYFRALKSGCRVEDRQLESKQTILNAFAIFLPAAWRLLVLGLSGREALDSPPELVLSNRQVDILRLRNKMPLSSRPTPRDLMLAVAAEGGHIKNNGDPGWQVLGRGYEALLLMEIGWILARRDM